MGERKVQNKYFPPDFDPAKLPRGTAPKNNQWNVRMMLPFSCQCLNCGEFMGAGKKFNVRMEPLANDTYLGVKKFRFYQKCPLCSTEFTYVTDPENSDYAAEANIKRLSDFVSQKRREELEQQRLQEELGEDAMKQLEDRTADSRLHMEIMDNLDELMARAHEQSKLNPDAVLEATARTSEADTSKSTEKLLTQSDEEDIQKLFEERRQRISRINEPKDIHAVSKLASTNEADKQGTNPTLKNTTASVKRLQKPARPHILIKKRRTDVSTETSKITCEENTNQQNSGQPVDPNPVSGSQTPKEPVTKANTSNSLSGGLVGYSSSSDSE